MFAFALLVLVYWWFASAAGSQLVVPSYYDLLAEGFRRGQPHLPVSPRPELLALSDPYDPALNGPYRLQDASLYNGRYYLYWGPLPAIPRLVWLLLTGDQLPLVFFYCLTGLLCAVGFWLILRHLEQRSGWSSPGWLRLGCTLVFGLSPLLLHLEARPSVFTEPLLLAMALAMWSWYALARGLAPGSRKSCWLASAGALLMLAIASRVLYAVYAIPPTVLLALLALRASPGRRSGPYTAFSAYLTPLVIGTALLAIYNWARFGSPMQFGLVYALIGSADFYHNGWQGAMSFDPSAWITAAILYVAAIPTIGTMYPYIGAAYGMLAASPDGILWPEFADGGRAFLRSPGLFVELPILSALLVVPAAVGLLGVPAILGSRERSGDPSVRSVLWCLLLGVVAVFVLVCAYRGVSLRYLSDFVPALSVLSSAGLLGLVSWSAKGGPPWRAPLGKAAVTVAATSGLITIALGLALGAATWQLDSPDRAWLARSTSDELLARVQSLNANAVPSRTMPEGRNTWRLLSGETIGGGTLYLRAGGPSPSLVVNLVLNQPTSATLRVLIGEATLDFPLEPGRQWIISEPLADVRADQTLPVRFLLDGSERSWGRPLPVVVVEAGLVHEAEERDEYRHLQATTTPYLIRGMSGEWFVPTGVSLVIGAETSKDITAIVLEGRSEMHLLAEALEVTASRDLGGGTSHPVPARVHVRENDYTIWLDLHPMPDNAQPPLVIRLEFSPYFVPSDFGLPDTRHLVVRSPTTVRVVR